MKIEQMKPREIWESAREDWEAIRKKARTLDPAALKIKSRFIGLPASPALLGTSMKVEKTSAKFPNIVTKVMYLSPAWEAFIGGPSSGLTLCAWATTCIKPCLGRNSGRQALDESFNARLWKTTLFLGWRKAFTRLMRLEVETMIRRCGAQDLTFSLRWNGSSDVPSASRRLAGQYPDAVFYDYTKSLRAALKNGTAGNDPTNYFLSYSFDGTSSGIKKARRVLKAGGRVSAVFDLLPGITSADGSYLRPPGKLPARFLGFPVHDGDVHDYIPADPPGVRGLRFKAAVDRAGSLKAAGSFCVDPCGELCQ